MHMLHLRRNQNPAKSEAKEDFETGSLTQQLEIISPPTAIDVLEGKAQFKHLVLKNG